MKNYKNTIFTPHMTQLLFSTLMICLMITSCKRKSKDHSTVESTSTESTTEESITTKANNRKIYFTDDGKINKKDLKQIQEHLNQFVIKIDKSHYVAFERNNKKIIRQIRDMSLWTHTGSFPLSEADKLNGVKPLAPVFLLPINYPKELAYRESVNTSKSSDFEWSSWSMESTAHRSHSLIFSITYMLDEAEANIEDKTIVKISGRRVKLEKIDEVLATKIQRSHQNETQ